MSGVCKTKDKRTVQKHCTLVDKVTFHEGHMLTIMEPQYMNTGIENGHKGVGGFR